MIPDYMLPFANHLWQSTLFVIAVWGIARTLRKNGAAVRHRLWLLASAKFLVPFSLLASLGSRLQWETITTRPALSTIATLSQPFSALGVVPSALTASQTNRLPVVLFGVWICGVVASLFWWFVRWRQVRRAVRLATPSNLDGPLRVMYGPARFEPGVFGIFRPVLLLPEDIARRLSPAQLQAVLAHEWCHARRHDNLAMAMHMVVEALFWFHPLVWFIKVRLLEEQERACDEEVLRLGSDPQVYAESILKICEFYLTSPLNCVAGITGSNLKNRIEDIMKNHGALKLSLSRVLLLLVAAITALAIPVAMAVSPVTAAEARRSTLPSTALPSLVAASQAGTGGPRGAPPLDMNQTYRIGEIKVVGAKVLQADLIRSSLGLVSGEVFNESELRKGFGKLMQLYGSLGYANFLPQPVMDIDEQRKVVNLTVNVDEGPQFRVNRIGFTGNTKTRDEVIRREIPIKEGDVFNASLLGLSLSRLNQLGLFEEIRIEDFWIRPSSEEPKLDIDLRVKEKAR